MDIITMKTTIIQ